MLFYNKMGREGVTENATFAQRPEGIEKSSHVDIWRVQSRPRERF